MVTVLKIGGGGKTLIPQSPSSSSVQDDFSEFMGLKRSIPKKMFVDEVLDPKVAEILSCSLRHLEYSAPHINGDPYFTPEEWIAEVITEKDVVIAEKEDVIAEKDVVIAEKEDVIAEKDDIIAEKDDLIAHLLAGDNPSGTTTKIREGTTTKTMLGLDNLRKRKGKGTTTKIRKGTTTTTTTMLGLDNLRKRKGKDSTTTAEGTETTLKKIKTSCKCVAHISDMGLDLSAVVHALVGIHPPLSDGNGKMMADVLLAYLLKIGDQDMIVHTAGRGTFVTVKFILQLPDGQMILYSGNPDFYIRQNITTVAWRAGYSRRIEETVRGVGGVGEVQSPPGATNLSKDRALAQAGIYTIGMFSRTDKTTNVATIVFYKDMTAHIALANIERVEQPPPGVDEIGIGETQVGHVKFELLDSTNPFNLQIAEDMIRFANVLIAALRMCSVSAKTLA